MDHRNRAIHWKGGHPCWSRWIRKITLVSLQNASSCTSSGIRFGGAQQPTQLMRTQIPQSDENAEGNNTLGDPQSSTMRPARISQDSGFLDTSSGSNSANNTFSSSNSSQLIETPSKGLAVSTSSIICPFSNSSLLLSSSGSQQQQCSLKQLQLLLSPGQRVFRTPLFLEFEGTGHLLGDFHSPIPEQSYGPLEARFLNGMKCIYHNCWLFSIADGILDDLVKLQPCTSLGIGQQQSPPKTPGKGLWPFWRNSVSKWAKKTNNDN